MIHARDPETLPVDPTEADEQAQPQGDHVPLWKVNDPDAFIPAHVDDDNDGPLIVPEEPWEDPRLSS